EILVFEHPLTGFQLVKGTIEHGESLEDACERELFEESGIVGKVSENLGDWQAGFKGQVWSFCIMAYEQDLPEAWEYETQDGGGLTFRFSWYPLKVKPSGNWHPVFVRALGEVRKRLLCTS
ncbi:MAG TPA: NUDIX domain-containing protein, partial [Cellvibrionaceae bacterium]